MSDKQRQATLPEIGEEFLRRPALVEQDGDYGDNPAALFAFTAHGFDTDLTPFYSAPQLKAAMEAAWTASRKLAFEEAETIVTRKADGVARVNTYRGRVNAASQHAVDMLEDAAAAIRQEQEEGK